MKDKNPRSNTVSEEEELWLSVKFQKQNLNTLTIKHVFTLKLLKPCKHLEFVSLQINLNLNGKSQNIHGEISLNLILNSRHFSAKKEK